MKAHAGIGQHYAGTKKVAILLINRNKDKLFAYWLAATPSSCWGSSGWRRPHADGVPADAVPMLTVFRRLTPSHQRRLSIRKKLRLWCAGRRWRLHAGRLPVELAGQSQYSLPRS